MDSTSADANTDFRPREKASKGGGSQGEKLVQQQ